MGVYAGPDVSESGLVLALDAGNLKSYPGSGTTWTDLSGNGNHFTLFNSPSYQGTNFVFDGVDDYMRSTNTIDLTGTNQITVDIAFNVPTVTTNVMAFEFTSNWNANSGAFGAFTNSNGAFADSPTTDNDIHTNSGQVGEDFSVANTTSASVYHFIFRSGDISLYYNSNLASKLRDSVYADFANFANSYLYIGSRGGTSLFGEYILYYIRVYNRALTAQEIQQKFNAIRARYNV